MWRRGRLRFPGRLPYPATPTELAASWQPSSHPRAGSASRFGARPCPGCYIYEYELVHAIRFVAVARREVSSLDSKGEKRNLASPAGDRGQSGFLLAESNPGVSQVAARHPTPTPGRMSRYSYTPGRRTPTGGALSLRAPRRIPIAARVHQGSTIPPHHLCGFGELYTNPSSPWKSKM